VLALAVVAIVLTLLGLWIFSISVGIVALILFALFSRGLGSASRGAPAVAITSHC
jgi:hypothetical protein